ncbi:MAG: hypothetical protein Q4B96_00055 [Bacillota bacterium]|nr:hypothetical protein [Bacillota bacterium]
MSEAAYTYRQAHSYERRRSEAVSGRKEKTRTREIRKDRLIIVMAVLSVFICAFMYTFFEAQIGVAGLEVSSLKQQILDTETAAARVDLEIGNLASLERIEEYAIAELGMVYPDGNDVYYLNEFSSLMIAQGRSGITVAAAEPSQQAVNDDPFWQSLSALIGNYFNGTASAAENQ